jgi:hypothetical protein
MGYRHRKIVDIEKYTKSRLEKLATDVVTVNADDPTVYKVSGIPVVVELHTFAEAMLKINRHLKFGVFGKADTAHAHGQWMYRELAVYMEGDCYALMVVGHGNGDLPNDKYTVYSRTVKNEKFRDDRDQYHMATSDMLDRALKNMKKHLRPYSVMETANLSLPKAQDRFSESHQKAAAAAYEARHEVLRAHTLHTELFHLLDMGHVFLSPVVHRQVAEWRKTHDEEKAAEAKGSFAQYVTVRLHRDEMVCDVLEKQAVRSRTYVDKGAQVTTYKMDELPEDIAGSLAALSMVEDGHYVEGVGYRVDSTTFWVSVE